MESYLWTCSELIEEQVTNSAHFIWNMFPDEVRWLLHELRLYINSEECSQGWEDCGCYLMQSCITLLAFSTTLQQFQIALIEPTKREIENANERWKAELTGLEEEGNNPEIAGIKKEFDDEKKQLGF